MGWDKGKVGILECGMTWAVKARRKGRGTKDEQTAENDQGKKVCLREDDSERRLERRAPTTKKRGERRRTDETSGKMQSKKGM